jgi:hypothetical protein
MPEKIGGRQGIRTPGLIVAKESDYLIRLGAATAYVFLESFSNGQLGQPKQFAQDTNQKRRKTV